MNRFIKLLFKQNKKKRWIAAIIIFLFFILNTFLVYITGGIPSAFAHTMYIPVLIAAILCGPIGAFISGIIGGLLVGPFMSMEMMPGEGELLVYSLYRTIYFSVMGVLIGILLKHLQHQLEELQHLHTHDHATGIPNFHAYLEEKNEQNPRIQNTSITFQINNHESLISLIGNDEYNNVLSFLYQSIQNLLPGGSNIIYVDERRFWIEAEVQKEDFIKKFITALEELPIYSNTIPLYIEFSIGISQNMHQNPKSRFRESDIASMYAKNHALKVAVYRKEYEQDHIAFKRLGELPKAIKEEKLFLEYQPIVALRTKSFTGMEALIRWKSKENIIYPGDFIPLAEKTRIINQITTWVCERVILDYHQFTEIKLEPQISINISQRNLYEPALIQFILEQVQHSSIRPDNIEIEITESTLMLNKQAAEICLKQFQDNKISVVLDDFGNEYSSLAYLRDLPIKKIKIDRNFTMNIVSNENTKILVQAIIDLAHDMNYKVVAEGIETKEILDLLIQMGCDFGQGYLFARPMRLEQATEWLKNNIK